MIDIRSEQVISFAGIRNCHPLEITATYYDAEGQLEQVETTVTTKALLGDPPADAFNISTDNEVPLSKFDSDLGRQPRTPAVLKERDNRYWKERSEREGK